MKKFLCFILICIISSPVFAIGNNKTVNFDIDINQVPFKNSNDGDSSGLSGGAVTGIVLGSVFGGLAAAGGLWYYFAKRNNNLKSAKILYQDEPCNTVCFDEHKLSDFQKYKYLTKTIEKTEIKSCPDAKYLLISDAKIQNGTFDSVYFKLPEFTKLRIIQISEPYKLNEKIPELDAKILYTAGSGTISELPMSATNINPGKGILEKSGQASNLKSSDGMLAISYNNSAKNAKAIDYAILVEFLR